MLGSQMECSKVKVPPSFEIQLKGPGAKALMELLVLEGNTKQVLTMGSSFNLGFVLTLGVVCKAVTIIGAEVGNG